MWNAKYNAHSESLFKGNEIFTIEDIFKLNCLKLNNKFINKNVRKFFKDIFTRNSGVQSHKTRNRDRSYYFHIIEKAPVYEFDTLYRTAFIHFRWK